MRKIQMVDLQTQYQFIKPQVDAGMQEVLSSAQFINGPVVKEFQNERSESIAFFRSNKAYGYILWLKLMENYFSNRKN